LPRRRLLTGFDGAALALYGGLLDLRLGEGLRLHGEFVGKAVALRCRRSSSAARRFDRAPRPDDVFTTSPRILCHWKPASTQRIGDVLSLVHAIARQTASREPPDFIGRFTERIQALAANQDLLVGASGRESMSRIWCALSSRTLPDVVGSRIAVHGPKLRLNAASAQAIGLALHELATNAGKYGALSLDAGRVDVRWRLEGDTFKMSWTERDGPAVSAPKRRGFGSSTVVDSIPKPSVGREVQLDYAPSGLVWRLTCPAANALDGGRPLSSPSRAEPVMSRVEARYVT
jgi:two-component sensor histidine kinase